MKKNTFSMYFALIIIFCVFGFITDFVNFRERNITNILIQNSYIFMLSIGMVLVIITGNIDLSVGSVVAMTGAVSAIVYNASQSIILSFVIALLFGAIIGMFQGYCVAYLKIPSFIVTLGSMLGLRGLTMIVTQIKPIGLVDDRYKLIANGFIKLNPMFFAIFIILFFNFTNIKFYKKIINPKKRDKTILFVSGFSFSLFILWLCYKFSQYKGIPNAVVIVSVVALIFSYIMKNTVFGRSVYAVGGNAKAAKLSGINSEQIIFYVFILMGVMGAFSGVIYTAYMNQALPSAGNMFELDAISAVFIGGASATGGIGTILGSLVGALVMGTINNGMVLMSLGAEWQYIVKSCVLLSAVWYDLYNNRKSK